MMSCTCNPLSPSRLDEKAWHICKRDTYMHLITLNLLARTALTEDFNPSLQAFDLSSCMLLNLQGEDAHTWRSRICLRVGAPGGQRWAQ